MRQFDADRADVLGRAFAAGVRLLVNVGADVLGSRQSVALAAANPRIFATVGIHPHEAAESSDDDWRVIEELAKAPRVVGIGERGLDRGPPNEPAYVVHTANRLAEVLGVSRDEIERRTEENTLNAFAIPREALA